MALIFSSLLRICCSSCNLSVLNWVVFLHKEKITSLVLITLKSVVVTQIVKRLEQNVTVLDTKYVEYNIRLTKKYNNMF